MKKCIFLCFFILLFGCTKDVNPGKEDDLSDDYDLSWLNEEDDVYQTLSDDDYEYNGEMMDPEKFKMYAAFPKAIIDDSKVRLKWGPVMLDDMWRPYEIVAPERIDIYISENELSDFKKIIALKHGGSYSYSIDGLQNGKPYFFYIVSKKDGFNALFSDTVMAVPNKRKALNTLLVNENPAPLWYVAMAPNKNKIAFVENYKWADGNCCLDISVLISNIDGSKKELAAIKSYTPSWSPSSDKIAFATEKYDNQLFWSAYEIVLYDCKTNSTTQLTNENYINLYPVFSENGTLLLFQSSKNAPGTFDTNIWMMNLKTLESFKVTDISKTSLKTVEQPRWIDNDRFLFHGVYATYPKEKYQVFESSVSNKQILKVFDSRWNDSTPSISPDLKKIAFISDRSGIYQVWIYHTDSKTFSQITGYSYYESVWHGTHIDWLDNSTIVFPVNSNYLIKQKI